MDKTDYVYERLCVPILDDIYFICFEHRELFSHLAKNNICYINTDMMGYSHIKPVIDELHLSISNAIDINDSLFKQHKSLLSVMNPKMNDNNWIKVEIK